MKTKILNVYNQHPQQGVSNEYKTSENLFREPCLHMICGVRNSGKSYLASKYLAQCMKEKVFDRVYLISPSFNSNKAYFGKFIKEEDVFPPTKESIQQVIDQVEKDRDEWQSYREKLKEHAKFLKEMKVNPFLSDQQLLFYSDVIEAPTYKYSEPVKSCLLLDDVLGSEAILHSSGLSKIATLNRHIAPLKEEYNNRSSCGLAVLILTQTYRCQNGISRTLRENLSVFTTFKNKQPKQLQAIEEELGNVVDVNQFRRAYEYSTAQKHSALSVDFNPKCETKRFRKNLNEVLIFPDMKCNCKK